MDSPAPLSPDDAATRAREIAGEPPLLSDDALALEFSQRFEGDLLYVPVLGRWFRWDGCRWAQDDVLAVFDLVRSICRGHSLDASGGRAERLGSAATVAAVERLARSDPRHARRIEVFDADPWALNTPAGVVDLRTGTMRPHCRDDLHTKVTGVAPGGTCRRWVRFLLEITYGNRRMVRYLQRFIGYTLTGITREHAFAFLRGPGGNGKSVLLATVAAVLGDYAKTAMAEVIMATRNEPHSTSTAALRGARMILVTETEEGRPWAEARLKALVAGDTISARAVGKDPFEFQPVGKWWIAGNHSPVLRNPDPAMRRRLHLVPLTYVPPNPDPDLAERLREELGGILAWAIQGCLMWQKEGLNPPPMVADAVAEYFADQDSIAAWLAERCERIPHSTAKSSHLFADWALWAKGRGEEPGNEKRFSEALQRHAAKKRTKTGVVFLGLRLLLPAPPMDGDQ